MLSTSLGQVGVVGQPTEQGGHHGTGVHLLLWRKGVSVREPEVRGSNWSELDVGDGDRGQVTEFGMQWEQRRRRKQGGQEEAAVR